MASALLASASIACGGEGFSTSGFRNARPPGASGALRPARVGAIAGEAHEPAYAARQSTKKTPHIAPPVKVDTSRIDMQHSSRRTAQQTPSGLTLRPAEPVALDNPTESPYASRRSARKESSLVDAYRKATDDVVNDSNRLVIREAEPLIPRSSSPSNAPMAVVPKPTLATADEPEPVTAEYEEEMVAAPVQEEEHLAPIVSSAGLKRPAGLGVRRQPDFVPPPAYAPSPAYAPPDVSVPPMPPKTSAVPSKRATTQASAESDSQAVEPALVQEDRPAASPSVASLQARRKFRGGPQASASVEEAQKPAVPEFASRDAYQAEEPAAPSASLARLEMPQVESSPLQLRNADIDEHMANKPVEQTPRVASSKKLRDSHSPTQPAKATAASSPGRILFLPPEPTPPKSAPQPRLLDVPAAVRAMPVESLKSKAATAQPPASSRTLVKSGSATREKPAVLLVKPAFAVEGNSSDAGR
jgi:hypothetical protein